MSQFRIKTPCSACPFRLDAARGWLGSYTPEDIFECIRNEVPFYCHRQIEEEYGYDQDDWREWADSYADHCAGALVATRRMCKLPRARDHAAAVSAIDPKIPILFPLQVFAEHHARPIKRK